MSDDKRRDQEATDLFTLYKSSATIHGLSHTTGPPLYCWRRFLWLFLVFGMAVSLSVIVYFEFVEYSKFATNTVVTAELHSSLDFPAVTICNLNQFHRSRVPLHDAALTQLLYNLSEFNELKTYILDDNKNVLDKSPKEWSGEELSAFASDAAHRLNVMLRMCSWRARKIPCEDMFERTLTDLGYCFTFNRTTMKGLKSAFTGPINGLRVVIDIEQDHYYFSRTTQAGIKMLLHNPEAPPLMTNHGIFVQPGTSTFVGITLEKRYALGPPYFAFGTTHCTHIDSPGFVNPVTRYAVSMYDIAACRRECFLQILLAKCGCRFFLEPGVERPCSLSELTECYLPHLDTVLTSLDLDCECPVPCKKESFLPVISVANFASKFIRKHLFHSNLTDKKGYIRDNMIDLRVYYESLTAIEIHQQPSMTITGILGDLGGLMGLFLGASILSLTEVVEILVLLATRLLSRRMKSSATHDKDIIVLTEKK